MSVERLHLRCSSIVHVKYLIRETVGYRFCLRLLALNQVRNLLPVRHKTIITTRPLSLHFVRQCKQTVYYEIDFTQV